MSELITTNSPTSDGYKCYTCGMWVYPGMIHQCWSAPQPTVNPITTHWHYYTISPADLEKLKNEIVEELEGKIEKLLKDIIAKKK